MRTDVVEIMVTYVFCQWLGITMANSDDASVTSTLFIVLAIMGFYKYKMLKGWDTGETVSKLLEVLIYWLILELLLFTIWVVVTNGLQHAISGICNMIVDGTLSLRWQWLAGVIQAKAVSMILVSLESYAFSNLFQLDDMQALFGTADDLPTDDVLLLMAKQKALMLRRQKRKRRW